MVVWRVVVALTLSLGLVSLIFESILGGVGMSSLVLLMLRWVMALVPGFGIMFRVGILL
jgi:hypothetical protein